MVSLTSFEWIFTSPYFSLKNLGLHSRQALVSLAQPRTTGGIGQRMYSLTAAGVISLGSTAGTGSNFPGPRGFERKSSSRSFITDWNTLLYSFQRRRIPSSRSTPLRRSKIGSHSSAMPVASDWVGVGAGSARSVSRHNLPTVVVASMLQSLSMC